MDADTEAPDCLAEAPCRSAGSASARALLGGEAPRGQYSVLVPPSPLDGGDSAVVAGRPAASLLRRASLALAGSVLLAASTLAIQVRWQRQLFFRSEQGDPMIARPRDVSGLYLENVGKDAGFIRNLALDSLCLDLPSRGSWLAKKVSMSLVDITACNLDSETTDQRFQFSASGQLVNVLSGLCVSTKEVPSLMKMVSDKDFVVLEKCDSTDELQKWAMDEDGAGGGKMLKNVKSGKCLGAASGGLMSFFTNNDVHLKPCTEEASFFGLIGNDGPADGIDWEFVSSPLDISELGFMKNQLTGKCINNLLSKLYMWDCAYDGTDSGQWWRMTPGGQLQNFIEGTCLTHSGDDVSMGDCASAPKWNWNKEGGCYEAGANDMCLNVDGVPAECAGHFLDVDTCDVTSLDSDQKWKFLTLKDIPPPPLGSPDRPLPDEIKTDISGIKGVLVKAGAECSSDDTDLGSQKTLEECMLAAHRNGWKYFSYGKAGMKKGKCFQENTESESCPEGFEADDYNFYKIEPHTPNKDRPFRMEMGELATKIYNKLEVGQSIAGWEVKMQCDKKDPEVFGGGNDFMAIFQQGDKCTWAIAGTDDIMDGITDIKAMGSETICGMTFHKGFIGELIAYMKKDCYTTDFAPYFASDACKGGRYVVGHSLGGAIAEAFAYVANYKGGHSPEGLPSINPDAKTFTFDGLYTFGAPGIAREPLTDGTTSDGCFKGARFFNIDANAMDPVPWVCRPVDFVHPKMDAVWLYEDHHGYIQKKELECGANESAQEPITDVRCLPKVGDHSMYKYCYRLEKLEDNSTSVGAPSNPFA